MFENILGHHGTLESLRAAVRTRTLPHALLLAGPRFEGKGSIALELARALTCHEEGAWSCPCPACRLHRVLLHQDVLMMGPRYFAPEIAAAAESLQRDPNLATVYLFVRSVRKLTRRFDPHLWSNGRPTKVGNPLSQLEELLMQHEPPEALPQEPEQLGKWVNSCRELARTLMGALPHDGVPVDMVRAVSAWARITAGSAAKVVIIEEVHTLNEAARNALLKVLEEPPSDVYFILTSTRRSAIIPTVLSRVRTYPLAPRPPADQQAVLQRIFRFPGSAEETLASFFRATAAEGTHQALDLARRTVSALIDNDHDPALWEGLEVLSERAVAELWLDTVHEELRARLPHLPVAQLPRVNRVAQAVARLAENIELRNMAPVASAKSLIVDVQRL